jgi:ATP phosphoribosyltransferase
MIMTPGLSADKLADIEKLKFRFKSIIESRGMKYVLMNLPQKCVDQAVALLPGMKSPTLLPLAAEGWYSLHVVIRESELWEKIEALKQLGAEDILVLSLENLIR